MRKLYFGTDPETLVSHDISILACRADYNPRSSIECLVLNPHGLHTVICGIPFPLATILPSIPVYAHYMYIRYITSKYPIVL